MDARARINRSKCTMVLLIDVLSGRANLILAGSLLLGIVCVAATAAAEPNEEFPLEPPNTSSPRGTLFNLVDNVAKAHRILEDASR